MTVVVGFSWLTEVVVIADTRVSWSNNRYPPKDILRKLYTLGDANKSAVLGFSGDLQSAKLVMSFLIEKKLKSYKRRFVMSRFSGELQRWIEEVATAKLAPEERARLQFLLCGIEPSRCPPIYNCGQVVGYTPFVEAHIYQYTIGKNGKVHVNTKASFGIIGSGQELERAIIEKVRQTIKFGFRSSQLHWARAYLIGNIIASMFKASQSTTVGGLFRSFE